MPDPVTHPMKGLTAWLAGTTAVLDKEIRLELRSKQGTASLLLFVLSSTFLFWLAVQKTIISDDVIASLLWMIILFAAALGLGRSFQSEEEGGTTLLLRMNVRNSSVYAGKLVFNFLLLLIVGLLATLAVAFLLPATIYSPAMLAVTLLLGTLALAGATTLLSAVNARVSGNTLLLPILLFPLLAPLLISAVNITQGAMINSTDWTTVMEPIMVLIGYAGVAITSSVLLFDSVWSD